MQQLPKSTSIRPGSQLVYQEKEKERKKKKTTEEQKLFPEHKLHSALLCRSIDFNEDASKRYSGHSVLLQRALQPPSPEPQLSNFPGTWKGNAC